MFHVTDGAEAFCEMVGVSAIVGMLQHAGFGTALSTALQALLKGAANGGA